VLIEGSHSFFIFGFCSMVVSIMVMVINYHTIMGRLYFLVCRVEQRYFGMVIFFIDR
jgi:hypothetical protein